MSDMRAIIAIGVSITSLVMVFGIFSLIPNDVSTMSTDRIPMAALGHVELKVIGPDGFIKAYMQTDNKSMDNIKECMMDTSFGGNDLADAACGEITQMAIGDSLALNNDAQDALGREFTATGRAVVLTNATIVLTHPGGDGSTVTANMTARDGVAGSLSFVIASGDTTGNQGTCTNDVDNDGLAECTVREVGLFITAGTMMFRSTFGDTTVEAGDKVEMQYLVTLV